MSGYRKFETKQKSVKFKSCMGLFKLQSGSPLEVGQS